MSRLTANSVIIFSENFPVMAGVLCLRDSLVGCSNLCGDRSKVGYSEKWFETATGAMPVLIRREMSSGIKTSE